PSMYIGGGTPTILIDELCETIDLARSLFGVSEVSCETNPNHLEDAIVAKLEGRVQRLSVGVQSFDDNLLKKIQRYDRFGSGEEILARIQAYAPAFQSFNVDMIFNFPGQTAAMLRRDAAMVIRSGANQTTFYPLMTSPTVSSHIRKDAYHVPAWQEAKFYFLLARELAPVYTPSSAWAFSRHPGNAPVDTDPRDAPFPLADGAGKRQGLIDEYIVDYDDYVGIGAGAFGYLDGSLYVNTFSLKEYRQLVSQGRSSLTAHRRYQRHDQMRYFYMMRLFGLHLDKRQFRNVFGVPVERGLWIETLFMRFFRAYEQDDDHELTLTPVGRYLMVVMMREFFNSVNYLREQARRQLPPDERALVP
ncbi:MAG: radical SAM protein, partial [Anaerolineaceae bacterium]|nr:radical SAM protein [Anaerolineaceae bacterium]